MKNCNFSSSKLANLTDTPIKIYSYIYIFILILKYILLGFPRDTPRSTKRRFCSENLKKIIAYNIRETFLFNLFS